MISLKLADYSNIVKRHRYTFPVNTKPILNIAAQSSQCLRKKILGSMKESFLEFSKESQDLSLDAWEKFYISKDGNIKIKNSADKLHAYLSKMPIDHSVFTYEIAEKYINDIVFNKTHYGMSGEYHSIIAVAQYFNLDYKFSNAEEESQGIDGFIGGYPVQVKPQDSAKKHHVRNDADVEKTLVITYNLKSGTCVIHNPEFLKKSETTELLKNEKSIENA